MSTTRRHHEAILEMQVDSFHHALEDLDPISRALVELSLKNGLDDDEIAGMMGNDVDAVRAQREAALRDLARRVAPESSDADLPELEHPVGRPMGLPDEEPEPAGREIDDELAAFV